MTNPHSNERAKETAILPREVATAASYPQEVKSNLAFLSAQGLWHIVSQNPPVKTCREAVEHRVRLGNRGIPLFDELKTSVGACDALSGRRYVAVHCRGNQRLDEKKLTTVLGGRFERLANEELLASFGAMTGTVNPFGLARRGRIQQVFDETVLKAYFPPNTMMTNLGDLCYGVEFCTSDVVAALEDVLVADVVEGQSKRVPAVHRFGILTGNGPESGILLWELINARIRKYPKVFRGDYSFPAVFIESLPGMGLTMELAQRKIAVRPIVLDGVKRLCERGATVVGIACNTTQYFADDVAQACERHGAQFVRTAEETANYLRGKGIDTFDFFGIGAVLDFDNWSGFGRALKGFDVRTPSKESRSKINQLAYDVKNEVVTGKTISKLRDLIKQAQTDVVVLALTELSILFADQKQNQKSTKCFVDTLEILAERMAELYIQDYLNTLQSSDAEQEESLAQSV